LTNDPAAQPQAVAGNSSGSASRAQAVAPRPAAVASRSTAVAPPPETSGASEDPFNALYDLADDELAAAPVVEAPRCPQCRTAMGDGAVLCVKCGYDTRTGKKLTTEAVTKSGKARPVVPGKKPVEDRMAAQGSFPVGVVVCIAGGLAVAVVWFGIAKATGLGLPLIGCATGIACGVGMHLGQKGTSDIGGIVAAAVTFLCIVATKVAIVYAILYPLAQTFDDEQTFRLVLTASMIRLSTIVSLVVGVGIAWRTASGSMSS
jgi:hypothetical protein